MALMLPYIAPTARAEEIDEGSILSVDAGGPYTVIYSTKYEDALKELFRG